MNRTDIAHQVSLTLGDHTEDFDIDAIVDDLVKEHGPFGSIDDIDGFEYQKVVERHDRTTQPTGFTAWLTTDPKLLVTDGTAEVNVTEDEATGKPLPMDETALRTPAGDDEAAKTAAEAVLRDADWEMVGDWEQYDHGYTIAVRRTA
jgi:hypothetical protein